MATSSAQPSIGYVHKVRAGIRSSSLQHEPEVKILASDDINQITIVLGDEFDDLLRGRLVDVLRKLGVTSTVKWDRFVGGSQDLESLEVVVQGRSVHIEAETYIGLSIRGPVDLVEQVRQLVLL
jgi:hypothetical protein